MVKKTYFREAGGLDLEESIWHDMNKSSSSYNAFDNLNYIYQGQEYDFVVDSDEELNALIASAVEAMGDTKSFSLQFAVGNEYSHVLGENEIDAFRDRIKADLISNGNNNYFYSWPQTGSYFPLNPNYFEVFVIDETRPS